VASPRERQQFFGRRPAENDGVHRQARRGQFTLKRIEKLLRSGVVNLRPGQPVAAGAGLKRRYMNEREFSRRLNHSGGEARGFDTRCREIDCGDRSAWEFARVRRHREHGDLGSPHDRNGRFVREQAVDRPVAPDADDDEIRVARVRRFENRLRWPSDDG
jgi:hypothetical protein